MQVDVSEVEGREFRQIRDATAAKLLQAPDETAEAPPEVAAQATQKTPAAGIELNAVTFLKMATHFFKDFELEP